MSTGAARTTIPKPAHLGPRYAAQFEDDSVARAYHTRLPYPEELFEVLSGLMPPGPRHVLDLGCGTGDVALGLRGRVERVDAVDPSPAMLRAARSRPGADDPRLRWVAARAEDFRPRRRYSLIVAAESFHWMDWWAVLSWIPRALLPGASLCLVSGREISPVPWARALGELIARYSTNREYRPYDLVSELTRRELFVEEGRLSTQRLPCRQTIESYLESFHTRNGFSRDRMGPTAAAFDEALRQLVGPHCPDGWVRGKTEATVVWGRPGSTPR
jgi:SAM-dependent methyltransferase